MEPTAPDVEPFPLRTRAERIWRRARRWNTTDWYAQNSSLYVIIGESLLMHFISKMTIKDSTS